MITNVKKILDLGSSNNNSEGGIAKEILNDIRVNKIYLTF